jgi:hypothetical protein
LGGRPGKLLGSVSSEARLDSGAAAQLYVRQHSADWRNNIMTTWLKLIGSAKSPITEWERDYVGFRKANRPSIRTGDYLFLYAPGVDRRIFALAQAVSDPEPDPNYDPNKEGSCRWKLSVRYEINLLVASGILVGAVSSQRDLTKSFKQQSHIRLLPEESESAKSELRNAKP